jgi:hypothetical protein
VRSGVAFLLATLVAVTAGLGCEGSREFAVVNGTDEPVLVRVSVEQRDESLEFRQLIRLEPGASTQRRYSQRQDPELWEVTTPDGVPVAMIEIDWDAVKALSGPLVIR